MTTNNNQKMELENIKAVQEIVRGGDLASLFANLRKLKMQLDQFSSHLAQREAEFAKETQAKQAKASAPQAEEVKQKPVANSAPATKIRKFDNTNNGGQRQQFGQARQNGQNNFKKPAPNSQKPAGPRLAKPIETFDVSTLAGKKPVHTKKKTFEKTEDKKSMNKKALVMRGYVADESLEDDGESVRMGSKKRGAGAKQKPAKQVEVAPAITHAVITTDNLTVKLLAEKIGKPAAQIIGKFLMLGIMVNINSNIDYEAAELVSSEFGITLEKQVEKSYEEKIAEMMKDNTAEEDKEVRPPVVTVMGHVDHGKTSLLDRIRKTNVVTGEAGGITQHIGAYTIKVNGKQVTFIDTPGHEAFVSMRERGAKLTDIAILVVAADDGVMPQTKESIKHIKAAGIPMIVAVNKIDKEGANIEKIKQELAENDVLPEEWGGDAILVPISAKTGENVDKLLEMVLFVAEYQNLRANPNKMATGAIIEAKLDKGLGSVATVLVQNGTLHVGDYVVIGTVTGRVRAMTNDKGERVKSAGPSTPVAIIGLSGVPNAGDILYSVDEKMSKNLAIERQEHERSNMIKGADLSIESMMNKIADSNFKDYNVIVKGDVQGSVEALKQSLSALQNEEVKVRVIHVGVGNINENDVSLAMAAHALIVAFNVKAEFGAKIIAEKEHVEIHNSRVIYEVLDYVTQNINKMLTPKYKEEVIGHAEVRMLFKASKVGMIAGSYILDGRVTKDSKVRITRNKKIVYEGEVNTLQREKDQAAEVKAGFECGITFKDFAEMQVGDIVEAYVMTRIN